MVIERKKFNSEINLCERKVLEHTRAGGKGNLKRNTTSATSIVV